MTPAPRSKNSTPAPRSANNTPAPHSANNTLTVGSVSSQRDGTLPPDPDQSGGLHVEFSQPKVKTEGADPCQLQFYEPAFRDIIERAKQFSHCDAAAVNSFPHRSEFNKNASEYIEEAIQERRSHGLFIPEGMYLRSCRANAYHSIQAIGLSILLTYANS